MQNDIVTFENHTEEIKGALNMQTLQALEKCGLVAEGYAKLLCPVDSGALRNSITHQVDPEEGEAYVGTDMHYAPYVEFGTGIYYDEGGRRTPWSYQDASGQWYRTNGQQAQPFIKPSVADHTEEYRSIINDALKN